MMLYGVKLRNNIFFYFILLFIVFYYPGKQEALRLSGM